MEFVESHGFSDSRDLILDSIRETIVKVVPKGTFSVTPDLRSDPVEFDNIFVDVLTILHGQMVQLVFCISDQVMWSKVGLEFQNKLLEVVHLGRIECQIIHLEEVWFEPFQSHAFEVQLHRGNFGTVLDKSLGMTLEVQFTRNQEGPEFAGACCIKLIRFTDLHAWSQFRGGVMSGTSKAADCACEVHKCVTRDLLIIILILIIILVVIEQVIIIWAVIQIVVRISII